MDIISRGFSGRRSAENAKLPPGQYLTADFPVLSAGPMPHVPLDRWEFTIDDGNHVLQRWDWKSFRDLPTESFTVDLHCVTRWSKLGTSWEGVSLDTILAAGRTKMNSTSYDYLDGNAAAGELSKIFAVDLTAAKGQCANCGATRRFADAHVYLQSPGIVARCAACQHVLLRLVSVRERVFLDVRGMTYLSIDTSHVRPVESAQSTIDMPAEHLVARILNRPAP